MADTSTFDHPVSELIYFAAFASVTWYNSLELFALCLFTFKRRAGCYFWSLLVASVSLIPQHIAYIVLYLLPKLPFASVVLLQTVSMVTWASMITGHSLVLWSRLHLVLHNPRLIRAILYLIIADATLLFIPVAVFQYLTLNREFLLDERFRWIELVEMSVFCAQEVLLSGVYMWQTFKMLKMRPDAQSRQILVQLLLINILVFLLDLLALGLYLQTFKILNIFTRPFVYSIKLKMEYAILGRLKHISRRGALRQSQSMPTLQGIVQSVEIEAQVSRGSSSRQPNAAL